jgi:hypothetical protein
VLHACHWYEKVSAPGSAQVTDGAVSVSPSWVTPVGAPGDTVTAHGAMTAVFAEGLLDTRAEELLEAWTTSRIVLPRSTPFSV